MIVIFCGVPACGKSTAARELVRRLDEIKENYKLLISDELSGNVYERVFRFLEDNIEETDHLIVDATFYKKKWRDRVKEIAKQNEERLIIVYLNCSLETSIRRNESRSDENRVEEKAIHIIQGDMEEPKKPDFEFDTDLINPKEVVEELLAEVEFFD